MIEFQVDDMTCGHCAGVITQAVAVVGSVDWLGCPGHSRPAGMALNRAASVQAQR